MPTGRRDTKTIFLLITYKINIIQISKKQQKKLLMMTRQ